MTRSSERSRPRRLRRLGIPVLATAMVLAACGGDDDSSPATSAPRPTTAEPPATDPSDPDPTGPGPSTPGSDPTAPTTPGTTDRPAPSPDDPAVVVGAVLEPTSLDVFHQAGAALDQLLLGNVYETLVQPDSDGNPLPGVADLPEVSADGLTYTFTLFDGITFHSGDPLTAADVVWSLDQSRGPDGQGAESLASIESVSALDERTVEIVLSQPDNTLLYTLGAGEGSIARAEATNLENTANGTGPFEFSDWNQGSSITLVRNDDYWGAVPVISGVTFQYFTDPNAAFNALQTGDVDILTGVGGLTGSGGSELIASLEGNPDFTVTRGLTTGEFTLGINNAREYLSDLRVRQAIRAAIDHEAIIELISGDGLVLTGPVPPSDPWFVDDPGIPFDPDRARQLLAEAGVPDGHPLRFRFPNFYNEDIAQFVVDSLNDVGFSVTLEPVDFNGVWLPEVYGDRNYDLTAVLHIEPRDIGNYGKDYYWNYDNPEVRRLIAESKTAPTYEESVALLQQATEQIIADSPVDWLFLAAAVVAAKSNVSGYAIDNVGRFPLATIVVN